MSDNILEALQRVAFTNSQQSNVKRNEDGGGGPYLVLLNPEGDQRVVTIDYLLDRPCRKRGTFAMQDIDSFLRLYDALAAEAREVSETGVDSRIYVDASNADSPSGIRLDQPPAKVVGVVNDDSWGDHEVTLTANWSRQWITWMKNDGQWMKNRDLANHIEDNCADVLGQRLDEDDGPWPTAADMVTLARQFRATSKSTFATRVDERNGSFELHASTDTETVDVTCPERFRLCIPVLNRDDPYIVEARFSYRVTDGQLAMRYELLRNDRIVLDAINQLVEKLRSFDPQREAKEVLGEAMADRSVLFGLPAPSHGRGLPGSA